LLLAVSEPETSQILESFSEANMDAQVIGRVLDKGRGVKLLQGEQHTVDLPRFEADEITRAL
jgi:hydrogenase maturation factor